MDPRERADAALARARARGAFVVTPEDAISPMDAASTLQIPRVVVSSLDQQNADAETTMVVSHPLHDPQPTQSRPSPRPHPQQQQQRQQQPPTPPRQPPPPEQEQVEGMVPTTKQQPSQRPTMSQRLDGQL